MKRVRIVADTDPVNPREWDYAGRMICWHDRYNLGDKHDYSCEDFMRRCAFEADNCFEDMIEYLETEVWERLRNFVNYGSSNELVKGMVDKLIESAVRDNYVILPLYLYDHSGISMSTSSFSCWWDSGQVGYIICDNETIKREFNGDRELAEKYLCSEVEVYDHYLTGDVYGFIVEDENGEEIDSCYGFYGSDPLENGMSDHLDSELIELAVKAILSITNQGETMTNDVYTDVVFLRHPNNDNVFAVFPFLPATDYLVTCYEHVGQHSGASLWYCDECDEITDPDEYADLADELTRIGYQLRVVRKGCFNTSKHVTARR